MLKGGGLAGVGKGALEKLPCLRKKCKLTAASPALTPLKTEETTAARTTSAAGA